MPQRTQASSASARRDARPGSRELPIRRRAVDQQADRACHRVEEESERQGRQAEEAGEHVQIQEPGIRAPLVQNARHGRQHPCDPVGNECGRGLRVAERAGIAVQCAALLHHVRVDRPLQIVESNPELAGPERAQRLEFLGIGRADELVRHAVEGPR